MTKASYIVLVILPSLLISFCIYMFYFSVLTCISLISSCISVSAGLQMPSPTTVLCCSPQSCFRREVHVEVSLRRVSYKLRTLVFAKKKGVTTLHKSDWTATVWCLPLVSKGNKKELRCSLECKYLNSDDYKDLLWTTLSEFPGTNFYLIFLLNIVFIAPPLVL